MILWPWQQGQPVMGLALKISCVLCYTQHRSCACLYWIREKKLCFSLCSAHSPFVTSDRLSVLCSCFASTTLISLISTLISGITAVHLLLMPNQHFLVLLQGKQHLKNVFSCGNPFALRQHDSHVYR